MNGDTRPVQIARGSQYGTPMSARNAPVSTALNAASNSRDITYPPAFSIAIAHTVVITCCSRAGNRLATLFRSFGISADM